MYVVYTYLF